MVYRRILLFCLLAWLLLAIPGCAAPAPDMEKTAAIIDQLSVSDPGTAFVESVTAVLEAAGYRVDYISGNQVTVDCYRSLPSAGYDLILFRAHAGQLGGSPGNPQRTYLYTSQAYRKNEETACQLAGRLGKAGIDDNPPVFAVNASFVAGSMKGSFDGAAVIVMGCHSLAEDDMARAFVEKGASVYIGWTESVDLCYAEDVTLSLLQAIFSGAAPAAEAAASVMQEKGTDLESGASLAVYPTDSAVWLPVKD